MDKTIYVNELKEGDRVDDLFLVKSTRAGETRAGKPYLIVTFMDKSGEISGPVWDSVEQLSQICQPGTFVHLMASVGSYRDQPQLKIDRVLKVDSKEVDTSAFTAACEGDRDSMAHEIQSLIHSVENPFVRRLLGNIFSGETWELFQEAPAAKAMHHGYLGGLMEHCLSMAKLADLISNHYRGVDRSLLIAGVMLHDIGKLSELAMDKGLIEYTDSGRLKGHLVMGSEMVAEAAAQIDDFPTGLLQQIQHLILSHHGQLQFGSPTVPMTVEALLLSQIDDMDAKMNMMEQLRRKMKRGGYQWTDYQRSLERFLFLHPLQDDGPDDKSGTDSSQGRQQSLF